MTAADTPDPASGGGSYLDVPGSRRTAAGRVRFSLARWVLAPLTTRQARRLADGFGPGMDARTAWALARVARHPDEYAYVMAHLDGPDFQRTVRSDGLSGS
ncbi:hypothetical protein [Streptomyces sp. NPDC089919]|uniref:hypothetical protein n=1 Tax=Streptomyces sp. NPDC089919 TaxID=3155188 RepID=UPI003426D41E